jgi:phosphoribosylaminoimidazole-succinocarboxamide synthase
MGSVKDLEVISLPTPTELGVGRFIFSDRYSVFDWGEMPDHIPHKGESMALLGGFFFEELEDRRIRTHYMGMVEDGVTVGLMDLREASREMEIELLRIVRPSGRDYSTYLANRRGALIPLEVIYRNSLSPSVFKRLEMGLKLEGLGLDSFPTPGQILDPPLIDFSTKFEASDRYLTTEEAKEISSLTDEEFEEMKAITLEVDKLITEKFQKIGLRNEDGKLEFGLGPHSELILVDVVGTLDECRFTYEGLPVSKEIARIYYRKTDWYRSLEWAKTRTGWGWRELCPNPPNLPSELKTALSQIYCACTNGLTGRNWFEVPHLGEVLKGMEELR